MGKHRSVRTFACLGAMVSLLAVVVALAVTGAREPASALRLVSGDVWLANVATGTASHLDGYAGRTDRQVPVSHPGDPFTVVQRPDGAYMLDTKTGSLTRVSDDGVTPTVSAVVPGSAPYLQVITTPSSTWVLDRSSGVLQQLNAALKPTGAAIPLGGPTDPGTADASGNLWIPITGKAVVDEVDTVDGSVHAHRVGQPGDDVEVAVTSQGVWAVDPQAGKAQSLTSPTAPPVALPQLAAGAQPVLGTSAASDAIVILDGSKLLDVSTATSSLSSTTSPGYAAAHQVVLNDNMAYLLDVKAHQLDVVNLDPLAARPALTVPVGSNQLVANNQLVFVNNTQSPQAAVINANGQVTDVSKYQPAAPKATAPATSSPAALAAPPSVLPGAQVPSTPADVPGQSTGPQQPFSGPTAPMVTAPPAITAPPAVVTPPPAATATPSTTVSPAPTTTVPSPPGAATGTTMMATATTAVKVAWTAPASLGSGGLAQYNVELTEGATTTTKDAGTATSLAITGLTPGAEYCAKVQAVGPGDRGGPYGSSVCATTPKSPGSFTVTVNATDANELVVTWTAASVAADQAAATYSVSDGSTTLAPSPATATTVTFRGLTADQGYNVTVIATDSAGQATSPTLPATPWGRSTAYECEERADGFDYVEPPVSGFNCGSDPAHSDVVQLAPESFGWWTTAADGPAPPGSVALYVRALTVNGTEASLFYTTDANQAPPDGDSAAAATPIGQVFTAQPGPSSQEICQALSGGPTSYYLLYVDGSQPGGEGCVSTFWT